MLPFPSGPLPPEQIRAILGSAIMRQVTLGWRVETHFENHAVMATGGRVNHALHAILTIFLCGAWLPIWVILAATGGEKRMILSVDPNGVVLINGQPAPLGPIPPGPPRPPGPPGVANARAVADANLRRDLRRRAREQAAEDPGLARELGIGRPDLPRHYDDGGLIDLNHAPPAALTALSGVTPEIAERIASIRDEVGGFSSAEELMVTADLSPDLLNEIKEYGVFLR